MTTRALPESIKNLPDTEILAFVKNAESMDDMYVTEALEHLCNWYDVSLSAPDGDWKCADELIEELESIIE